MEYNIIETEKKEYRVREFSLDLFKFRITVQHRKLVSKDKSSEHKQEC